MSVVSDALAAALSAVASAKGETLSYRQNEDRAWTTLSGFVLDRDDVQAPAFDDESYAEATVRTARLSGPLSPTIDVGYQILDGNGGIWAVYTTEKDQQQLCAVRFITLDNAGPDRGGTQ